MTAPYPKQAAIVAGAGPAGLAAAHALARAGRAVTVVERERLVGGIARTVERNGYRFDVGGHRFFTRLPEVRALWDELLGDDLLLRPRRSRILYRGRYYDYPLTAGSALAGLGAVEAARILASYLAARARPIRPERSLADWVTNRFGRRLFETFFRSYTEKVWGMPCEAIGPEWAAQRIRGLSLGAAALDMLRRGAGGHRSLVTEFHYPRLGPGMLWSRMAREIEERGGRVLLSHRLVAVRHEAGALSAIEVEGPGGRAVLPAAWLVSTIPLRELAAALAPPAPREVLDAALRLRFRSFLSVATILGRPDPFPDTWLYLHDPTIVAGRVQNFRAWSPDLVPSPDTSCLGMEYFCWADDALWRSSDAELVETAAADLARLGFAARADVREGHVTRVREAYPVYDAGFAEAIGVTRRFLETVGGLVIAGRGGLHRYDNMDHAMRSGLRAAENVLGARHDLWAADAAEYLEPAPA